MTGYCRLANQICPYGGNVACCLTGDETEAPREIERAADEPSEIREPDAA